MRLRQFSADVHLRVEAQGSRIAIRAETRDSVGALLSAQSRVFEGTELSLAVSEAVSGVLEVLERARTR